VSGPDSDEKPRAGRVRHDSGGRAIWEWAVESGKHAVDSTSHLLKKLELTRRRSRSRSRARLHPHWSCRPTIRMASAAGRGSIPMTRAHRWAGPLHR
jgi:hypothetical protein